jgi:hypothetical protein
MQVIGRNLILVFRDLSILPGWLLDGLGSCRFSFSVPMQLVAAKSSENQNFIFERSLPINTKFH